MSVDRHGVWRQFKRKIGTLEERAPEGFALTGHLYVLGREEPIQLGVLETSRAADAPWTWLQAAGSVTAHADETKRMPHPDGEWIFLPEAHIVRVEVRYVPEIEDPPPIEIRDELSSDE
jgi:hypothetical protein